MRQAVEDRLETTDSEITLSATTLLGIFFGLVLICGVFFGFGYSTGRHGETAQPPASSTADETTAPTVSGASKPSAMQSLEPASTTPNATTASANAPDSNAVTESLDEDSAPPAKTQPAATPKAVAMQSSGPVATTPTVKPASLPIAPSTLPAPAPASMGSGTVMVQIAAVTRSEDANALASALRQRGYTVSVRNEPQDKLLHVQVGPFATRDAAKATRAKLIADGYNAILKQ
jgi:DedD protein